MPDPTPPPESRATDPTLASDATLPAPPGASEKTSEGLPGKIGRYRIARVLGEGGMGMVYEAEDPDLARRVAIKVLRPDVGGDERRLLREARSMAQLSHPNIVAVYDVGEHEGAVYVAMEYVPGPTLRRWAARPENGLAERFKVLVEAGSALAAAHEAGLVHRDFKPDNVLVGDDGRVRVLDFGLARSLPGLGKLDSSGGQLTRTGAVTGTPRYMSPEQMRGKTVGPAGDQFSFCLVAYEVIWGQGAFDGETFPELAAEVLRGAPKIPPPKSGVPEGVWPLLARGLSPEPNARFPQLRDLVQQLRSLAPETSALAREQPGTERARDAAREQLASGFADSRLNTQELDARLERLEDARSPNTVQALVADLQPARAPSPPALPALSGAQPESKALVPVASSLPAELPATSKSRAILSGRKLARTWEPGTKHELTAIMGGLEVDLRNLSPGEGVVEFHVKAVLGEIKFVALPGTRVDLECDAVLGEVSEDNPSVPYEDGTPRVRITGTVVLGEVNVVERMPGEGTIGAWWRRRKRRGRKALPPPDES